MSLSQKRLSNWQEYVQAQDLEMVKAGQMMDNAQRTGSMLPRDADFVQMAYLRAIYNLLAVQISLMIEERLR